MPFITHSAFLTCFIIMATTCCNNTPPIEDEDMDCSNFSSEWGQIIDDRFVPFKDGDSAELTLGFQGFLFIDSVVRVMGTNANAATVSFQINVEGQEIYEQRHNEATALTSGPEDHMYAQEILVFFNNFPLSDLVGRSTEIIEFSDTKYCSSVNSVQLILVDDDDCVEQEDEETEC